MVSVTGMAIIDCILGVSLLQRQNIFVIESKALHIVSSYIKKMENRILKKLCRHLIIIHGKEEGK